MAIIPDPKNFPTVAEWQKAMQDFYGLRSTERMRTVSPLIEKWEMDWKKNLLVRVEKTTEPAIVTAIKEEIKEANLLGWFIERAEVDYDLYHHFQLHYINAPVKKDPPHSPFTLYGSHPDHGRNVCLTCFFENSQ